MAITKIDKRGRITIPKEIREDLNLKEDDELLIFKLGDNIIVLKKIDFQRLINDALREFEKIEEKDIERIRDEINKLAREKIEASI